MDAENDITLSPVLSTVLGTRVGSRLGLRLENYVADNNTQTRPPLYHAIEIINDLILNIFNILTYVHFCNRKDDGKEVYKSNPGGDFNET